VPLAGVVGGYLLLLLLLLLWMWMVSYVWVAVVGLYMAGVRHGPRDGGIDRCRWTNVVVEIVPSRMVLWIVPRFIHHGCGRYTRLLVFVGPAVSSTLLTRSRAVVLWEALF